LSISPGRAVLEQSQGSIRGLRQAKRPNRQRFGRRLNADAFDYRSGRQKGRPSGEHTGAKRRRGAKARRGSRLREFDQFSSAAAGQVHPWPRISRRQLLSPQRKLLSPCQNKTDYQRRKRWLLVILLLFLPVSFQKKKSNKIPAVLCRRKGRQTFAA
jgi:hypothetical protein